MGLLVACCLTARASQPWTTREAHDHYAHVLAADTEDPYNPEPGYRWIDPQGPAGSVHWSPGKNHPNYANFVAADTEGTFQPVAGYEWDTTGKLSSVHLIKAKPRQPAANSSRASRAERFRRFLASKGAILDTSKIRMEAAIGAYINEGLSPLGNCGIREVVDNPTRVKKDALSLFGVDFKHPADSFCLESPDSTSCNLLADNCITLGTSIFCDIAYLRRLRHLALAVMSNAWSGVREGQRRGDNKIYLTGLKTLGLIDLAHMQHNARIGKPLKSLDNLEDFPFILAMEIIAQSNLLEVLSHVVYNLVLAHEIAHIEQKLCPDVQYLDSEQQGRWTKIYKSVICEEMSTAVEDEINADLRAIELVQYFLEMDLKALANHGGGFSPKMDSEMRREFQNLLPYAKELALLAVIYSLEYELLVHLDPEGGFEVLKSTPPPSTGSLAKFIEHYVKAGSDSAAYIQKGHMDPALRALFLIQAIDRGDLGKPKHRLEMTAVKIRLQPYIIGRLLVIQRKKCGRPDDEFRPWLIRYVKATFGEY
jgi:hypothetical protein